MDDDLVKRLREAAISADSGNEISESLYRDILQAADAIETLATNYDASTDIMKHQTEYIEGLERERDSANEAATALYSAMPKWIPVTERLPENGAHVLVTRFDYITNTPFVDLLWFDNSFWNRLYSGDYAVTHWMPLPEPPKEE